MRIYKPVYITQIVQQGYDAQLANPLNGVGGNWKRRVLNPYANTDMVGRGKNRKETPALITLDAKAYECGVRLAYDTWSRPHNAYYTQHTHTIHVDTMREGRLQTFHFADVPRHPDTAPPYYVI